MLRECKNSPYDGIRVTNIDNLSFHHWFFRTPNNDLKIFIARSRKRHIAGVGASLKLVWKVFETQLRENKAIFLFHYQKPCYMSTNPVAEYISRAVYCVAEAKQKFFLNTWTKPQYTLRDSRGRVIDYEVNTDALCTAFKEYIFLNCFIFIEAYRWWHKLPPDESNVNIAPQVQFTSRSLLYLVT